MSDVSILVCPSCDHRWNVADGLSCPRCSELAAASGSVFACFRCGDYSTPLYCLNCAGEIMAKDAASINAILVNALRYLNTEQMHALGEAIAVRSNATFTPNEPTEPQRPEAPARNQRNTQ